MPVVERNGVRLHYAEHGSGPTVLFHTGGGGDGRMWELAGYTDALDGYRHLLMDHRGHGRSDQPVGLAAHAIDEYVADVIAVLDHASVDRAVLLGYSSGADVLYRTAAAHPDRCLAVVGIGAVPTPFDEPGPSLERAADVRRVGMRTLMEGLSAQESEPAPGWLIDNLAQTPADMFAHMLEAWADTPSALADFAAITAPTSLICGENEVADGDVARVVDLLAKGSAIVIPGFGHLQTFWHAEVTAPLIVEFLRTQGIPAR
ncbi:MAG TPA: alpha/beta hydrolase [Acidothermaceae bacterium]|nr:alpha/beta hydrolase [Acidothermaceae bacterium]